MTRPAVVSEGEVRAALRDVIDPELDQSLVDLGFVDEVCPEGERVTVVLRLPTFWCAPNFAYLMAHDVRQQVLRIPGVRRVRVVLKEHFAADEISAGVSEGRSFAEVFPGEAEDDLEELRQRFRAKAFMMRQEQFIRCLLNAGLTAEEVVGLRVGDVERTGDPHGLLVRVGDRRRPLRHGAALAQAYLEKRRQLGLDGAPTARLITDLAGGEVSGADLTDYLRQTRRQRVSMAFNAVLCRGLFAARYGRPEEDP